MKIRKIRNWEEFISEINSLQKRTKKNSEWLFRGVKSKKYDLIPDIGRDKKYSKDWEKEIFDRFKRQAVTYLTSVPRSKVAWLALARHSGLPTRLLDWTSSPLIAAYFAVSASEKKHDAAIYTYLSNNYENKIKRPFSSKNRKVIEVCTEHCSPRITAQKGYFTLHRNPTKPFRHPTLRKIIIPKKKLEIFREKLDFYGINADTVFPDLNGLAQYLTWIYRD